MFTKISGEFGYLLVDLDSGTVLNSNVVAVKSELIPDYDCSDEEVRHIAKESGFPLFIAED